jgi:Rod binding domain-containing protein
MTVQQVLFRMGSTASESPVDAAREAKLSKAAEEFESMMLNELLKPLHFGAGVDEGQEESADGAADTMRGLGTDALGKALAAQGGFGIARKVVKEVTGAANHTKVGSKGD